MTHDLVEQILKEKMAEHDRQWSCNCSVFKITRRKRSDDVIVVVQQCQRCGRQIKTIPKKGQPILTLPWFNEDAAESFRKARSEAWQKIHEEYKRNREAAQNEQNEQWWKQYSLYLKSQAWHRIRQAVLERDGNICQACLRNKAAQVHHISYELYNKTGRSAAYELVSVCYNCHKAIHPGMAEAQHSMIVSGYNPYLEGARNVR